MAPPAGLRTVASAQKTEAGKKSTEQEVFLGVKVGGWASGRALSSWVNCLVWGGHC